MVWRRNPSVWTSAVVDDLRKLAVTDLSAQECAQFLNSRHKTSFSRNAILGKFFREKIKRPHMQRGFVHA